MKKILLTLIVSFGLILTTYAQQHHHGNNNGGFHGNYYHGGNNYYHGGAYHNWNHARFHNHNWGSHDRFWWRSNFNTIVFINGCWYVWYDGFYYPAYGYDPYCTY